MRIYLGTLCAKTTILENGMLECWMISVFARSLINYGTISSSTLVFYFSVVEPALLLEIHLICPLSVRERK